VIYLLVAAGQDLLGLRMHHILGQHPPYQALLQRHNDFIAIHQGLERDPLIRAAVGLSHNHVLADIHQAAGEVAGVGSPQRRVHQALARAVGGDDVFGHG
jgi:hypothetical protein